MKDFELFNCYPNPFNPSTTIKFSLPVATKASLKVYDVLGKVVAELLNSDMQKGEHEVKFNAEGLAAGLYFYTLKTDNHSVTKKMMLLK